MLLNIIISIFILIKNCEKNNKYRYHYKTMKWTDKVKVYLDRYFNIKELRPKQIEAINEIMLGRDSIVLLPTGYGKSLCYLLPPMLKKKLMINL